MGSTGNASDLICVKLDRTPAGPSNAVISPISSNGQISLSLRRRIDVITPNTALLLNKGQAKGIWKPLSKSIQEDAALRSKSSPTQFNLFDTQIPLSEFPPAHMYIDNYQHPTIVEPVADTTSWHSWKSTCWSPANLTSYGGCLLATLTMNCDCFIVAPKVNFYVGKWLPTYDISKRLREHYEDNLSDDEKKDYNLLFSIALKSQISCMAWSANPPTYSMPVAPRDISVLVTGTKGGDLVLWKHLQHGQMELVTVVDTPSDSWISLVTTSVWTTCEDGFTLSVFFMNTDYALYEVVLKHTAHTDTLSIHSEPTLVHASNGQSVTTLTYVDGALLWTTPGSLFIKDTESGVTEIDTENLSMVVGLEKVVDIGIVLWFVDGEIKVIEQSAKQVSRQLSQAATHKQRKLYEEIVNNVYKTRVGKMQSPFVYSARKLANSNGYVWLFHHRSPEDTEYFEEAKLSSVLSFSDGILPQSDKARSQSKASLVQDMSKSLMQLTDIWTSSTREISGVIEKCQEQIDNSDLLNELDTYFDNFVEAYRSVILSNYNPTAFRQLDTAPTSLANRIEQMLSCDLWTMPAFDIVRKVYLLSTQLNIMTNNHAHSLTRFRQRELEATILVAILYIVCQRIQGLAEMQLMPMNCTQVIARLTHTALYLQASPSPLRDLARHIQNCYPGMGDNATPIPEQDVTDPLSLSHAIDLGEICPATDTSIIFDNVRCAASPIIGVDWPRCAVTLNILSDVHVKRSVSSAQMYTDLTFANVDHVDILTAALSYSAKKCLYTNAPFARINDIQ
ncbi:hypothetical protein E3P99_00816 [Wallemia hederae]|uniref:Transcription factor IIIC 90kDa subunit N-terminal domain-containing protein n=1 Tax=Wallemia hederae TaxID=1540922 RepID=A0A4T0FY26_9BASI|nr:hypothetical protein E3P99_00816 [Wallemia hederae]